MIHGIRGASHCLRATSSALLALFACFTSADQAQAQAQQPVTYPITVPIMDVCINRIVFRPPPTNCSYAGGATISRSVSPNVFPGENIVTFKGQLQVDGVQISLSPGETVFSPVILPNTLTNNELNIVVSAQYATNHDLTAAYNQTANDFSASYFRVSSLQVSSLGVNVTDRPMTLPNGVTASYSLSSIDPKAVTGNSTALAGRFRSITDKIIFGTFTGKATVAANPGRITLATPGSAQGPTHDYLSPFELIVETTTPVITTQLDETGLITPKIEVTNGIDMNGSRVTELADGTAPTDAVNRRQLDGESTARNAAVQQLNQRILVEETNRASADLAIASQVNTLGTRLDQLQSQVAVLDDHIASATAVAVAMSGNAFLPGMRFNLTANVATYDGAHAGSLQIGALLSDHVAINAGVATGFNRRGKTAGRVGMTLGW